MNNEVQKPTLKEVNKTKAAADTPETEIDVHVITIKHFERALKAFTEKLDEIDQEPHPLAKEFKETSSDLRKAMQSVLDERKMARGAKDRLGDDGDTGDALDLDDVRAEILARLARMRDGR